MPGWQKINGHLIARVWCVLFFIKISGQGSELTTYDSGLMDFSQLFDDNTSDPLEGTNATLLDTEINQSINTPQVEEKQPVFPAITSKKSKK